MRANGPSKVALTTSECGSLAANEIWPGVVFALLRGDLSQAVGSNASLTIATPGNLRGFEEVKMTGKLRRAGFMAGPPRLAYCRDRSARDGMDFYWRHGAEMLLLPREMRTRNYAFLKRDNLTCSIFVMAEVEGV